MLGEFYLFWMSNTDWFYFDDEGNEHLTEKAPERARKSFEVYTQLMEKSKETGICY